MDFDVESLSTRICQLDGLPRILRAIVFLERRKLALRNRLYPSSNNDKALKFRFLDLPIEIQILIIREYIQGWPLVGQTPDLIKALRPQPGTYQQALAVFYSSRTVTISANNEHRVLAMPKSVLRKAVSVDICYGNKLRKDSWTFEFARPSRALSALQYCNIRSLTLLSKFRDESLLLDQKQLMMLVRKAIIKLPLLRKLTLEVLVILCNWQIQDDGEYTADLEYLLKNVNRITGVLHQWVEAQNPFHVAVFWDTGNNGTLTWTTGRHWRSIKWRIAIGFNAKLYLPHMLHMMYYWEESRVHFLGLNPRRLLHICRDRSCKCYRFILLRVTTFDPKARFHLGPSFEEYAQEENQPEPVGDYSVPNKFSHGGLGRVLRMTSVELF